MSTRPFITVVAASILAAFCVCNLAGAAEPANVNPSHTANNPLPEPPQGWTRIASLESHLYGMFADEYTIFSLESSGELTLNVYIFDENKNLLGEFDSTGCGILLHMPKPQNISIAVVNFNEQPSEYLLHVFD